MVRRLMLLAAVALAILVAPAAMSPASAQSSPPSVLPSVVETTLATVAPQPPNTVKGVVVNRPLPRTGGDFGIQVIIGGGLTAAGLAFAVSARLRRQRVTAHTS